MTNRQAARAAWDAIHPPHVHRWRIEEANGPTSAARCQGCPATREMRNDFIGDEMSMREAAKAIAARKLDRKRERKVAWI